MDANASESQPPNSEPEGQVVFAVPEPLGSAAASAGRDFHPPNDLFFVDDGEATIPELRCEAESSTTLTSAEQDSQEFGLLRGAGQQASTGFKPPVEVLVGDGKPSYHSASLSRNASDNLLLLNMHVLVTGMASQATVVDEIRDTIEARKHQAFRKEREPWTDEELNLLVTGYSYFASRGFPGGRIVSCHAHLARSFKHALASCREIVVFYLHDLLGRV
jgi:hypothetical protein